MFLCVQKYSGSTGSKLKKVFIFLKILLCAKLSINDQFGQFGTLSHLIMAKLIYLINFIMNIRLNIRVMQHIQKCP